MLAAVGIPGTHLDSRRVSTLTGTQLRPMPMLTAHSMPLIGMTLKNVPTGVCIIITCNAANQPQC